MRASRRETVTIGALLERLLGQMGMAGRMQRELVLLRWREAVGPVVARHTRPLGFRGSTLIVRVRNSAWAAQLAYFEAGIVARLNALAGTEAVADIQWVVGRIKDDSEPGLEGGDAPAPAGDAPPVPGPAAERIAALAGHVADPRLREAFAAAATAAWRRSAWGLSRGWRPCARCGIPYPAAACPACRYGPGGR